MGIDIKWVMKKNSGKSPAWDLERKIGHIFLDRSTSGCSGSLADAKKKLIKGTSVVIFPKEPEAKQECLVF
jgi:1-acyl-sn-glycerol-3-phosphate acyltransferase